MNNDPLKELITLANEELKSGTDKSQVINRLVSSGVKRNTAEAVIQELCKPKPYYEILFFFIFVNIISVGISYITYSYIGIEKIISLTWLMLGVFAGAYLFFLLFNFSGKAFSLLRVIFSSLAILFAVFLTLTLFMHNDWESSPDFYSGGRWGALLGLVVDFFYFIGSTGFALIMVIIYFLTLLMSWAEWHKFIKGDYDKIE